jgi:TolB protein
MIRRLLLLCALIGWLAPGAASAQDTTANRIRLALHYVTGMQPGLVVVASPGLDSVRRIIERDLGYSDRFTMDFLPDSLATVPTGSFDPRLFQGFGLAWVVVLEARPDGVQVQLYDVANSRFAQQITEPVDRSGVGDSRLSIHQVSDQIVNWATGGIGIAATRIVFKMTDGKDNGVWRIDSDGANLVRISRPGGIVGHPTWSPDGGSVAYPEYRDAVWTLYIQRLNSGTRVRVPTTSAGNSLGPGAFSPDGRQIAFSFFSPDVETEDIEVADISQLCCAHRLTTWGQRKLANSSNPTYSPDGRRIAFMSDRPGTNQIYVMDADGSEQRALITPAIDASGQTTDSYNPEWSPDGTQVAFARDVSDGGRQVFTYAIGSEQVVQRTSEGRNEDPSWAPDSRHLVIKSRRTGREQLWVLDVVSGATRQIPTPGTGRWPAWSRLLTTSNP